MKKTNQRIARLVLVGLANLGAALIPSLEAQDYSAELAAVAALGDLTTAPAIYTDDTLPGTPATLAAGDLKIIYYDALDYLGNPTRACAWIGIPLTASALTPVPAVVLVHGGGGTAFETWVQKWNDRGYAAVSMSVEGKTETGATHAMPGPARSGIYNDTGVTPISDQWMYHAVADTVLANSLLRSLPEVDADKVGVMGVSWGGVITSTVMGIDTRFSFAIPTYGCGHLYDARNLYGAATGDDEVYKQVWDPMVRMANATMPALWYSWPDEPHFPMDSLAYNYHAAPGAYQVSLVPGMGHGHGAAWNRPECYDFADSVVSTGAPWCAQQSVGLAGNTATVVFASTLPLHTASLVHTTGNDEITSDISTNLVWTETALAAPVEGPPGTWTVTATLPAGVTGWFVNVEATGSDTLNLYGYVDANVTASSDYQEVIDLILSPADGLAIEHPLALNESTATVDVSYTGPANVEVTSITVGGESHPGAFTSLTPAPLVLLNPTPAQTPVTIQFDNTVAGLTDGQTATATLTIVRENLDGSTDQVQLPLSATALAALTVIYDTTSGWSSQMVQSVDDVIIRNGATVTAGAAGPPPNLVVNGSFEAPDIPSGDAGSNGGFSAMNSGSTALTGWTVAEVGVVLIDSFDNFDAWATPAEGSDGDQFVQLQTHVGGVGTISQDLTTEVGTTYLLTFDYSGIYPGTPNTSITYNVGGGDQVINLALVNGQLPWVTEIHEFTATATTTTLSFTGQALAGFWGSSIDNIRVTEVAGAAAANITVNDDPSPTTATLEISEDLALTATGFVHLGAGTGAGFVNQSNGSVTTPDLTINSSGTGDTSRYDLSGGLVDAAAITVNDNGELSLTGGTVTNSGTLTVAPGGLVDIDGGTFLHPGNGAIDGFGLIQLRSGTFSSGTDTSDGQILKADVEISGGTFAMLNQVIFSQGQPLEFRVIGDEASITMRHLQFSGYTNSQGTLKWIFDETGVSPINVTSWMFLDLAKIVVDGSAYTGGAGTFLLLDSTALLGLADPGNITVTGFAEKGLSAAVVQDQTDGNDWVQLEVTLSPYGTWVAGHGLTGTEAYTTADPDGDGWRNLLEFALGGDPNLGGDLDVLPTVAENEGVVEFAYRRRVNPAGQGLIYTVTTTTDLVTWGTEFLGAPVVTPIDAAFELVTHELQGGDRLFARLQVELVE